MKDSEIRSNVEGVAVCDNCLKSAFLATARKPSQADEL
jgi:hypothetical protein